MTFRTRLEQYLTDRGMWPQEAEEIVVNFAVEDKSFGEIVDKAVDSYPDSVLTVLVLRIKHEAIDWIDANKPLRFAKLTLQGA